jgi:hypothetical protein
MANRYNGSLIVVDTTDTQIGGPNAGIGPKQQLHIQSIYWVATAASNKDIADGDKLTIEWVKDGGDIVIACDAQLAAVTGSMVYKAEFHIKPWSVPGLYIEDIDGGELQVFLV